MLPEITELRAENERLRTLNQRLAQQVVNASDRIEESRRELLATGWDAGFATGKSRAMRAMSDEPSLSLHVDNPYRKPVQRFGEGV